MSAPLPIVDAARVLGVPPGTLRRWMLAEGFPIAQRGRRGRGCTTLIDPDAVSAWRTARKGNDVREELAQELASAIPQVLADGIFSAFLLIEEDPAKRDKAGVLAGTWFVLASAVVDYLRKTCPSLPEVRIVPGPIDRLRKISKLK